MAKDPVCGMEVDEKTAPAKSEHMGKTYYFCAPGCKKAFDENPAKYLEAGGQQMAGHDSHSCNVHPVPIISLPATLQAETRSC